MEISGFAESFPLAEHSNAEWFVSRDLRTGMIAARVVYLYFPYL
jgi:hypothetical protein